MPYLPMICAACRRRQERWQSSKRCACGGPLAPCERAARKGISFAAATGQVVRNTRMRMGLTGATLAQKTGLSRSFLSDLETGKRGVSLENWVALGVALGGHYTALLGEVVRLYRRGKA